jgi:hypothetical protein
MCQAKRLMIFCILCLPLTFWGAMCKGDQTAAVTSTSFEELDRQVEKFRATEKEATFKNDNTPYFPNLSFSDRNEVEVRFVEWFSKHLKAMNEPSLWAKSKESTATAFRFLWLRTFDHPICVRLTIDSEGQGELAVKETDGAGGYESGNLVKDEVIHVDKKQVAQFLEKVNKINFWNMPGTGDRFGADGARWVIEGVHRGKYHVSNQWTPEEGGFRETALLLVKMANLKVSKIY